MLKSQLGYRLTRLVGSRVESKISLRLGFFICNNWAHHNRLFRKFADLNIVPS